MPINPLQIIFPGAGQFHWQTGWEHGRNGPFGSAIGWSNS